MLNSIMTRKQLYEINSAKDTLLNKGKQKHK